MMTHWLAFYEANLAQAYFLPDLLNHAHTRNLTRTLIERGFEDSAIEKILGGNWLRYLRSYWVGCRLS